MNKDKDELPQKADGKADKQSQKSCSHVDALSQKPDSTAKKPRRKKNDGSGPAELENTLIGQQVHGILDGCFDAGYLLSVRVGDSTTTLRGLVFEPGLSIPLSKVNDIAPKVNATMRDQHASLPTLIWPNPADLVAGSSPTSQLVTTALPIHIQSSGVATQSTALTESQAPLAVEQGQIGSELAGPVATNEEQEGPELADPVPIILEQVSVGPGGQLITDAQSSSPTLIPKSQEQKEESADDESKLQLQSN